MAQHMTWADFVQGKKLVDVAREAGVSVSYLSRINSQQRRLSEAVRWRLFAAFNVVIEGEPCAENVVPSVA